MKKVAEKKSFNVSLQSKKYSKDVRKIVNEWGKSENLSTEVCESILLYYKFNSLLTLINIKNTLETAEKMLSTVISADDEDYNTSLDEILNEVVTLDLNKLLNSIRKVQNKKLNNNFENNVTEEATTSIANKIEAEEEKTNVVERTVVEKKEVQENADNEILEDWLFAK